MGKTQGTYFIVQTTTAGEVVQATAFASLEDARFAAAVELRDGGLVARGSSLHVLAASSRLSGSRAAKAFNEMSLQAREAIAARYLGSGS